MQSSQPPGDVITDQFYSGGFKYSRSVQCAFHFDPEHRPLHEGPPVTFGDAVNLFTAIRGYYVSRPGHYAGEMSGDLLYDQGIVGFFFVEPYNIVSTELANTTLLALGDSATNASTAGASVSSVTGAVA